MNRICAGIIALPLILGLAACSPESSEEAGTANSSTSTSEAADLPGLGDEVTARGATMVLHDLTRADEIEFCAPDYQCGTQPNVMRQADQGGEFLVINSTVTNNSKSPMDLTCSAPIIAEVVNKKDQTYSTIDSLYEIPGNPECNEELQPGFSDEMRWVYLIPKDSEITRFQFKEINDDFDGEYSYIDLSKATAQTSAAQPSPSVSEPTSATAEPGSNNAAPVPSAAPTPAPTLAPAPEPAAQTPAPAAPVAPVIGYTEAPGIAQPTAMNKTIQSCGDPTIHQTGTTFFTDGTSGWTQQCSAQMGG